MEKYQCPLDCFLRLETSPSIQSLPTPDSMARFILRTNWVTERALFSFGGISENRSTGEALGSMADLARIQFSDDKKCVALTLSLATDIFPP